MDLIIKNIQTPLLIKNTLSWDLLKWDLNKWTDIMGDQKLIFRRGKNSFTSEPQFENITDSIRMTFGEFLNNKNEMEWFYFDYKYLKDWFVNCEELRQNISWDDFGFPEINVEDSTIWIGSKGAHTPCHVDSYGCNIIAQVYGRKRWLLFPPEEDLHCTRIPYEESSTFSKINFFAPPPAESLSGIQNCYSVILNPGDVLVVPHKWWHYVENLELAISINAWIKLPVDYEERVKEAIVRTTIVQYLKELHLDIREQLLITNAEPNMFDEPTIESFSLVSTCLQQYHQHGRDSQQVDVLNINKMLDNYSNMELIQQLTLKDFHQLLDHQRNRFSNEIINIPGSTTVDTDDLRNLKKIIDTFVHRDVVQLIYKKLTED